MILLQHSLHVFSMKPRAERLNTHTRNNLTRGCVMSPEIGVTVKVFSEVVFAAAPEPHRPTRLLSPQQTFRTFRPDNCAAAAATKGKVFTFCFSTCSHRQDISKIFPTFCWILLDIVGYCPPVNEGLRTFLPQKDLSSNPIPVRLITRPCRLLLTPCIGFSQISFSFALRPT